MKVVQTSVEVPEQLYKMAGVLVKEGWFRDENVIFAEAIRRFLDSHRGELMEKYILDDVEWGIDGND